MSFYDMPSASLMTQYTDVRLAMPKAITGSSMRSSRRPRR